MGAWMGGTLWTRRDRASGAATSAAQDRRCPGILLRVQRRRRLMIRESPYLAVVPAYNEVGTVASVVRKLNDNCPDFDVLVIDDGSRDGTAQAAEVAGARVLRLPFNLGIGGTVQAGFKFAEEHGYQRMVQVD